MADRTIAFRTAHEECCVPGVDGAEGVAPALLINPGAPALALAGAALARADTLRRSLLAWSCISGAGGVDVAEVAQALEPNAHEVLLLLDALVMQLNPAEPAAKIASAAG